VKHLQRVMRFWVAFESFGHKNVRAQVHRTAPKLGQQLGLNPNVADVFRIRRRFDRRDLLI